MKRPAFQFYPSDWLRDTALRTCSIGARGLWIDIICYMHQGTPYGHLKVGEKVILPENLARMVGETLEVVEGYLSELEQAGVFDQTEDGAIYSRRMIRDESIRNARAEGGKKGGNPLLVNGKVNLEVIPKVALEDIQKPTPSSSSSSSSSNNKKTKSPAIEIASPNGVSEIVWKDFVALRKAKKATITSTALEGIKREAEKANVSLEDALKTCCMRGWTGFKADWVLPQRQPEIRAVTVPGRNGPDPVLLKIEQDRKLAVAPSPEIVAKLAQLRKATS